MGMILGFLGLGKIQAIVAAVLIAAIAALSLYAWDADRAVKREHDAAQAAQMERDAYAKAADELKRAVDQRNRLIARFTALPRDRQRLCAVQGPLSGCCTPDQECKP